MIIEVAGADMMQQFGRKLGMLCRGGEVIVLAGDIGVGKTTLTKGIAAALGVTDDVQSPTFTISRVYETGSDIKLAHYDFYRLSDPGLIRMELTEVMTDDRTVTVIEWAAAVSDVVPDDTLTITIEPISDTSRRICLAAGGPRSNDLMKEMHAITLG